MEAEGGGRFPGWGKGGVTLGGLPQTGRGSEKLSVSEQEPTLREETLCPTCGLKNKCGHSPHCHLPPSRPHPIRPLYCPTSLLDGLPASTPVCSFYARNPPSTFFALKKNQDPTSRSCPPSDLSSIPRIQPPWPPPVPLNHQAHLCLRALGSLFPMPPLSPPPVFARTLTFSVRPFLFSITRTRRPDPPSLLLFQSISTCFHTMYSSPDGAYCP